MRFDTKNTVLMVGVLVLSALFLHGCMANLGSDREMSINIQDSLGKKNVMPLVIIGSGPAGLSAAIYGVWGNIPTLVIHGPKPGGLLMETSLVENWPGHKAILGADIIKNLQSHVKSLGTKFLNGTVNKIQFLEDTIAQIDFDQWPYTLTTEQGVVIYAMSVIVATGATPRMLQVPGEQEYWSRGVTACAVCDAPFFKGKDVVVVGAGDSAAEEAMQLAKYAKTITILGRKEKLRAAATMQSRLKEYPSISVQYNVEVKKIIGDAKGVTGVEIYNNKTKQTTVMPTNGVFLAIGHVPNSGLFKNHLKTDAHGYIETIGRSQMTSMPGWFVAGDVEDNVYRQAGVAAGHGIQAALDAVSFLNRIGYSPTFAAQLDANLYKAPAAANAVPKVDAAEYQATVEKTEGLVGAIFSALPEYGHDEGESALIDDSELLALAQQFDDKISFIRVNSRENVTLAKKFHIEDEPCLVVYNQGKFVARYAGPVTTQELAELVRHLVDSGDTATVA